MKCIASFFARHGLIACLMALTLAASATGCGRFMRPIEPGVGSPHAMPRPLKRLQNMRREREIRQELEGEKFPRAEQVGLAPAKDKAAE